MRSTIPALFTVCGTLLAQNGHPRHGGWADFTSNGLGGILMLAIPVLLIGILFYFVFGKHDVFNRNSFRETPLDIIRRRYAKGEITRKEFERMKSELSQ